jgi:hypothetical protein
VLLKRSLVCLLDVRELNCSQLCLWQLHNLSYIYAAFDAILFCARGVYPAAYTAGS